MMNLDPFVCHPSIRIRGTENNYNPVPCLDDDCQHRACPHMHCPFCTRADAFQDPVILRAHYRVKHVDKGLDFAGLKVLRCCDNCDIIGAIKGEKKFKGAHWHCYRCRNGFNRRDEAVKHFNTHFRNPQTTFQIQIAQEVNSNLQGYNPLSDQHITTLTQHEMNTSSTVAEAVLSITTAEAALNSSTTTTLSNGGRAGDIVANHTSVAANETVQSHGGMGETIMIIEQRLEDIHSQEGVTFLTSDQTSEFYQYEDWCKERCELKKKVAQLQVINERLEMEKEQLVQHYHSQIEQLKLQVQVQEEALMNQRRQEQELMDQLSSTALPEKVQKLLQALRSDHEQLLNNHLVCVRDAVIQQLATVENKTENEAAHILDSESEQHVIDSDDLESRLHESRSHEPLVVSESRLSRLDRPELESSQGLDESEEILVPQALEIVEDDDSQGMCHSSELAAVYVLKVNEENSDDECQIPAKKFRVT